MIAGALAFLTGVGLMALPAVLTTSPLAADLLRVVGPIAAAAGFVSMTEVTRGLRRINVVSGAAVAIIALVAELSPAARGIGFLAAVILVVTALVGPGTVADRHGGGWRVLLD